VNPESPHRRVARCFAGDMAAYTVFWVPIVVVVTVAVGVLIARTGTVDASLWQGVHGFTRWLLVGGGFIAARHYLPMFVAHGISRRHILAGIWPVMAGLAVVLGVATGVAFAVEGVVFDALGWNHVISDEGNRFLYQRPDQYTLIIPATAIADLSYLVTGTLIGATYARGGVVGTLLLPVSVLPALVTEVTGGGWLLDDALASTDLPVAAGLAAGLAACALGAVGATLALRNVELDNDNVAWWR
jgi:hypothetical protein